MNVSDMMRAFVTILAPLTGEQATGGITATATGLDVVLGHGHFLYPVIKGQIRHDRLFKLARNTVDPRTNKKGTWTITNAGTLVDVYAAAGGERCNLPAGTVMRWADPVPDGIAPTAVVTTGGTSGGLDPTGFAAIRRIGVYEELGMPAINQALFKAAIDQMPAVVFYWESSSPAEGSAGDKITQYGYKRSLWREQFQVIVLTTRADSDERRRGEGLQLIDDVIELLHFRNATDDGMPVSHPEHTEFLSRSRVGAEAQYYVYGAKFRATRSVQTRDHRQYAEWLRSRVTVIKPDADLGDKEIADFKVNQ